MAPTMRHCYASRHCLTIQATKLQSWPTGDGAALRVHSLRRALRPQAYAGDSPGFDGLAREFDDVNNEA